MSKRAEESFATSASAKQKPVHCTAVIARIISDKNADMDHHASTLHQKTELEATPTVKTCVSKILKESPGRRQEHHASGNWKRLQDQSPGDRLLQKILQVKRKFIFIQILMEKHMKKFDDPAIFQAAERRGARILQSSIWTVYVQGFAEDPADLQDVSVNVCDLEPIYERLLMDSILAYKGSRRLQKDGNE